MIVFFNIKYFRYYVLIHDNENNNIIKLTVLFDFIKRHFKFYYHLFKLKNFRN